MGAHELQVVEQLKADVFQAWIDSGKEKAFLRSAGAGFENLHFRPGAEGRYEIVPDAEIGGFSLRSGFEFSSIYDFYRAAKERRYRKHLAEGYAGPICVAEGDSWFELPPIGYATDLVFQLNDDYAILSLAKAGDSWEDILRQNELLRVVADEKADIVLLSAGGNNVLGRVSEFVHKWSKDRDENDYVNDNFENELSKVMYYYDMTLSKLMKLGVEVILHGYGYCDPRPGNEGGYLIGGHLSAKRNINNRRIWKRVIVEMIDRINRALETLASLPKYSGRVHYHDFRKSLPEGREWWQDEVHPTRKGFEAISGPVGKTIDEIWSRRKLTS